jgi:hypothetical protein
MAGGARPVAIIGSRHSKPDEGARSRSVAGRVTRGTLRLRCRGVILLITEPKLACGADSNRSLSTFEPVSVRDRQFCREKVLRGQRPGRNFWRHPPIPGNRDRAIRRLRRQSRGNSKTIPAAPGNRSCEGVRGGAGRTQTCNHEVMNRYCGLTNGLAPGLSV